MCQGLGPKQHDEISEIDRRGLSDPEQAPASECPELPGAGPVSDSCKP